MTEGAGFSVSTAYRAKYFACELTRIGGAGCELFKGEHQGTLRPGAFLG